MLKFRVKLEAMLKFRVKRECYNEKIIVFRAGGDRYVAHHLVSITRPFNQEDLGTTSTYLDHRSIGNIMLGCISSFYSVTYFVHCLL
jgi:hypothetical protein